MNITKTISCYLNALAATSLISMAYSSTASSHSNSRAVNSQNQASHQTGRVPSSQCRKQSDQTTIVSATRASTGHFLVKGSFNSFITKTVVDTGGIGVGGVLSADILTKIKQPSIKNNQIDVQGANHTRPMQILNIDFAGVEGALIGNMNFVVSPNSILPDDDIPALIGSQFLCNFLVEFDLQNNQLKLYPRDHTIEKVIHQEKNAWGVASFTDIQDSGAVLFEMEIDTKKVRTILDTGARHSIMNWKAAKLLGLEKSSPELIIIENTAKGIHGNAPENAYTYQLGSLSFAESSVQAKNMQIHISDLGAFKPIFGNTAALNLGIDFLNGRRLLIDYSNKKIAMTK